MKSFLRRLNDVKFAVKMKLQIFFRGHSDLEVWDLGRETLYWMLPRLKQYRKNLMGHPIQLTSEQWEEYIDELIAAIELLEADNNMTLPPDEFGQKRYGLSVEEYEQVDKTLRLLGFWILGIWD